MSKKTDGVAVIHMQLPQELADRIDLAAEKRTLTRSALMRLAVMDYLDRAGE